MSLPLNPATQEVIRMDDVACCQLAPDGLARSEGLDSMPRDGYASLTGE